MYTQFLHQSPNSVVSWVSGSTRLFGGHRSGQIKSYISHEGAGLFHEHRVLPERVIYLKANEASKNEETRKVE